MANLRLKKIWISPITDAAGRPLAAVYLDSTLPGQSPESTTEKLMEAVVQQISLALRNALLHADVVDLNINLEEKVSQRTRQLEQSRAELIARDRLATMGRLVAAIAHELNNPVGAIASLADTMGGMRDELLGTTLSIAREFPEAADNDAALTLLGAAVRSATEDRLDTHRRRELEARLSEYLTQRDVPSASHLAHRLARAGLTEDDLEAALSALRQKGDFLTSQVEKVHKFARGLGTIEDCAGHVARIVDGLKTYTHLDRSELIEADIHQGLQATLAVLASRTPSGVTVETRFADIPPFPHHPGQLTQVWTNLVDNALGAMGETGTLTITTEDAGDHVVVEIADTGSGIPEEMREQIFDLHVTTRGPGAGLGLGLPICRSIIEDRHGGTIGVESEPGHTVFTVTIPKEPPVPAESPS
jgi:signal transduction histidine kinase